MNPANKQDTRVALVTGSARRIGAAIVQHLHQAGFRVVIHYHKSHDAACALSSALNASRTQSATVLSADLCVKSAVEELMSHTLTWGRRLDLLVNNASVFTRDTEDWDALFTTNVKAPFWLSYAARPHLEITHGSIINITDTHAEHPLKDYAMYCQSKAALTMQTKALAREFAPNVRVNAVAPGAIVWPEGDHALSEVLQKKIINRTLLKRHGEPSFIAHAVLALADNAFITGQTLRVDGGRYSS